MKKFIVYGLLGLSFLSQSCGTNSIPTQLGGDPNATADLALPFSTTQFAQMGCSGAGCFAPFSSTNPSFKWTISTITGSFNVAAPLTGIVTAITAGATSGTYDVTIYFNSRFSVKISGINTVSSIQVGQYVLKGATIGASGFTSGQAGVVSLTLYQEGTAICPFSYLDSASRSTLSTQSFYSSATFICS